MTARTYRPRVEPVEAMQWTGTNRDELEAWTDGAFIAFNVPSVGPGKTYTGVLHDHYGRPVYVETGDWIVRGANGFTKSHPDNFADGYEPTERASTYADARRVLLVKPGDVLLVGNVGETDPDAVKAASALLECLGITTVLFAGDIDVDTVPATTRGRQ